MFYGEHKCLVCKLVFIPAYRAFCKHCFRAVPWELRAEVMRAYRHRVCCRADWVKKINELQRWRDRR